MPVFSILPQINILCTIAVTLHYALNVLAADTYKRAALVVNTKKTEVLVQSADPVMHISQFTVIHSLKFKNSLISAVC